MSALIQFDAAGPTLRGLTAQEDFTLAPRVADEPVGSGTSGTQVSNDVTFTTFTPATTVRKSDVEAVGIPEIRPQFESLTPAVCSVDATGRVSRVADGLCGIRVSANGDTRRLDTTITTVPGVLAFSGVDAFAAGSLRRHLWDQQLACFSGLTPGGATQRVFSGAAVNAANLVRRTVAGYSRPSLDALDQLLVGEGGPAQPFHPWRAWITPHHFLTWYGHFTGAPTATQRWVQEVCVQYSATAWTGALCKLLPANVATKLPAVPWQANSTTGSLIAAWARLRNVYVDGEEYWVQPVSLGNGNPVLANDPRRPWQRTTAGNVMATGGDSGSPIWTQINGELVVLCHVVLYGLAGGGGFGQLPYHLHIAEFNAALAALNASGTYTVQTVDLSAFTTY